MVPEGTRGCLKQSRSVHSLPRSKRRKYRESQALARWFSCPTTSRQTLCLQTGSLSPPGTERKIMSDTGVDSGQGR